MARVMRSLVAWALYPLLAVGGVALAAFALARGAANIPVSLGLVGATAASAMLAEAYLPFRSDWSRSHDDVRTDVLHLVISGGAAQLAQLGFVFATMAVGTTIAAHVPIRVWPATWPLASQLVLALVVFELGAYWLHRLQHERGFLWRIHAIHHSAPRLYWLTGARNHPLDLAVTFAVAATPLILLGASEHVLTLLGLLLVVHGTLQHANIEIELGPLARIINIGDLHRRHHSLVVSEANANYGGMVLLWDWVFGTYQRPLDTEVAVGLASPAAFPGGYTAQLRSPFSRTLWREGPGASSRISSA